KHTTTFAEMHPLSFGGFIIDTPGIKEFGLIDFERTEVGERFPEMRALMAECRFADCTHVHEPGCAVKRALDEGLFPEFRYSNYISILNDDYWEETESYD
ncbi:MAG: GTPase RsgA, partial [Bacteroidales bacterium]|nr:GTPase RsgA [Bacteroidales bacterium]